MDPHFDVRDSERCFSLRDVIWNLKERIINTQFSRFISPESLNALLRKVHRSCCSGSSCIRILKSKTVPANIKHLMTGPGETKLTVSRGTSLQVISGYIAGNFEAGNSLNLAVTAVVGQHSRVIL